MIVYYLINTELGWDNLVSIATSPQKCIEDYTDGEVLLETNEQVNEFLEKHKEYIIDYKTLKE